MLLPSYKYHVTRWPPSYQPKKSQNQTPLSVGNSLIPNKFIQLAVNCGEAVINDIKNYTNIHPTVQISEIRQVKNKE